MKTAKFLILILFLSSQILSQQIGDWKNYTSLRNVVTIDVDTENNNWGATSGGIFQFNPQDSTFKVYTKSEGLNSN